MTDQPDERLWNYAVALYAHDESVTEETADDLLSLKSEGDDEVEGVFGAARAVMAVADREQAELILSRDSWRVAAEALEVEVARLRESGRNWHRSALANASEAQRADARARRLEAERAVPRPRRPLCDCGTFHEDAP